MGMNVSSSGGKKQPEVMMEMNTTPLIDVMLVLLVMLIITIPIQLHSVDLNLPTGAKAPVQADPEVVRIDVDFDGQISWNGERLAGLVDLEARLDEKARQKPQPEIHLRPNKMVDYDYVAAVLASAQRKGLSKIGIVGNEQFVK